MSSKPTVTLTLAGDESKLTQAFKNVGDASEQAADKVRDSGREMEQTGDAFDSLGEATDSSESKFQGFADTLTGTQDIMTGFREGDIVGMATGFADLAGGLTEFVVPALKSMATFMMGPLRAAMSFIAAHPLLIFFGLLTAAVITLWTTSETFRNVVLRVFRNVGDFIKNVFGGALRWIVDRWNGLVAFFKSIPGRIGTAMGNLGAIVKNVFKGAVNGVVDALNWFLDHSINWLINRVNDISGVIGVPAIPTIPHIPRLHTGGIVPGMPGQEVPIIAMAGEKVVANGQGGSGGVVVVSSGGDSALASFLMSLERKGIIRWQGA